MIRKNTQSDIFQVDEWRNSWQIEFENLKNRQFLAKQLSKYDDYYDTRVGGFNLSKVRINKSGIIETRRAVLALQQLVAAQKADELSTEKLMKRQKLVKL